MLARWLMTAADSEAETGLCFDFLLQKLCGCKKLCRTFGIQENAAVIVNRKGALSIGKRGWLW